MKPRIITLLLFAVLPAFAQPACTQIADVRYGITPTIPGPWNGTISISLGYTIAPTDQSSSEIIVASGVVNICLPAGDYTAAYAIKRPLPLSGNVQFVRYWHVPATGGPYIIQYVESQTPATPALSIAWAQLPAPPASGTFCVQSVSALIGWDNCAGGGGGIWGAITGTLSNQTDLEAALDGKQAALGFTPLNAASNLSDLASATTARTNLGLGSAATQASSAFDASGAAAAAQAAAISASLQRASNLSDLASASMARTNLGLGSLAVLSVVPNPSASTLGGIESITCTNQFLSTISTLGVPGCATVPNAALSNSAITINGTACTLGTSCSPIGANAITALTGDVTATGPGSVAATVKGINGTIVSGLATGLYKNTTGTGALSIAVVGTDYAAATNGSLYQALTSNGAGGFGAAYTPGFSQTIYVDKRGNDSTGLRGNAAFPFLTVRGAVAATGISAGDLIFVGPGTFNETAGTNTPVVFPTGVSVQCESPATTTLLNTSTTGVLFVGFLPGSNSIVSDCTINGNTADENPQLAPIGLDGTYAAATPTNVTLLRDTINGGSDGIYLRAFSGTGSVPAAYWLIADCTVNTQFDSLVITGNGNTSWPLTVEVFNTTFNSVYNGIDGSTWRGFAGGAPGSILRFFGGRITVVGGASGAVAGIQNSNNQETDLFGTLVQATSTGATIHSLQNITGSKSTSAQVINVSGGTQFDVSSITSSIGSINLIPSGSTSALAQGAALVSSQGAFTSGAINLASSTYVSGITGASNGGTGIANTATLTLGSSNQNWATLGTGIVKNTTTTGALTNGAAADVYGLWSGSCSSSTYLNGAGACTTPGGSGTVTSVGFTGGLISVASPTTTPAFTVAGTSGGVPYFSSTSTWASSALLAANGALVGGGAGAAPASSSQLLVSNLGMPGTEQWTLTNTALGTAPAGGWQLNNSTVSLVGTTVQASPPLQFGGHAWKSTGTAVDQVDCAQIYNLPATGTAATTQSLQFGFSTAQTSATTCNGATYTFAVGINSSSSTSIPSLFINSAGTSGLSSAGTTTVNLISNATDGLQVGSSTVVMPSGSQLGWTTAGLSGSSSSITLLTSATTATIQHGAADAAGSPVAQTIRFQSASGVANTAGANATIQASAGTGMGAGGSLIFQVAPAGSTASTKNAYSTALTIAQDLSTTFAGTTVFAASTTGASTSTFTNSPCTGLTTEQWVAIKITGQSGTWYVPACQ